MKKLTLFSLFLAAVVIILGAYTRLTDAGLGCPDWPGCYGHLTVPLSEEKVAVANAAYPERPVEAFKAWNEMIHRYFAGTLGLCVLAIAVMATKQRHKGTPFKLPLFLLGLIVFQAALGMWTVTLNLLPVVVMGHLLGGFAVISCLFILYLRLRKNTPASAGGYDDERNNHEVDSNVHTAHAHESNTLQPNLRIFAIVGVAILVMQIALGGWTSANYAALACTEMPVCEAGWQDRIDVKGAYSVPDVDNYEFGAHDYGERVTMHIAHRFGAIVTFTYLLALGLTFLLSQHASALQKRISIFMLLSLCSQVALGISNIVFMLPLAVAVMHNAVAAILLLSLLYLVFTLSYPSSRKAAHIPNRGVTKHRVVALKGVVSSHVLTKVPGGFHG